MAFVLRALFALVHYYVIPLPDSQADAKSFERVASEWSESGFWEVLSQFRTGADLYPWFIAVLYSLFGRSPLMAQAVNVLLGTLIVYNVYTISRQLWGEKFASPAAWFAAFFPTLVLYSAITLREMEVVFFLTLGVLYFVRWLQRTRPGDFVKALVTFAISSAFHYGMLPTILVLGLASLRKWSINFVINKFKLVLKKLFIIYLSVIFGVWIILLISWEKGKILDIGNLIEWLACHQENTATGRAAYLTNLQPRNVLDLVWQTPIRLVYFLFTPFPWLVHTPTDLLGLVMTICRFLLTVLFLRSLPAVWRSEERRWVFYVLFVLLVTFSLGTSNYGTAIRHSSKLVPLILVVIRMPRVKVKLP